jgi:hypothetical protein
MNREHERPSDGAAWAVVRPAPSPGKGLGAGLWIRCEVVDIGGPENDGANYTRSGRGQYILCANTTGAAVVTTRDYLAISAGYWCLL